MPRGKRKRRRATTALAIVRKARAAAKSALESLRAEIRGTSAKLAQLISEERIFRSELFGGAVKRNRRGPGRPRKAARRGRPARTRARRRGAPQAEKFFKKLGNAFTLDDVRKLAGRRAGISLAQWSRAKRIRKSGKGYQKVAA